MDEWEFNFEDSGKFSSYLKAKERDQTLTLEPPCFFRKYLQHVALINNLFFFFKNNGFNQMNTFWNHSYFVCCCFFSGTAMMTWHGFKRLCLTWMPSSRVVSCEYRRVAFNLSCGIKIMLSSA